jgi:hypothetical protein
MKYLVSLSFCPFIEKEFFLILKEEKGTNNWVV